MPDTVRSIFKLDRGRVALKAVLGSNTAAYKKARQGPHLTAFMRDCKLRLTSYEKFRVFAMSVEKMENE